jgi:class 3 adenylate cyclase
MLYDDYRKRLNGRPAIKAVAATWTRPKQPNGTTAALTGCTVPAYCKFESISLQRRVRVSRDIPFPHRKAGLFPIEELRTVKNTSDGFLAEFASVVDAVRCAAEVQRGVAERNAGTPPERRIEFRVGVNLGDVIAEEHDIFGDGVNVAAPLEAPAEPGGICVSRVVRDQVRDRLDFAFEDLGEQSVKNIARPVRVYRVGDRAVPIEQPLPGSPQPLPLPDKPSIAVRFGSRCNASNQRHRRNAF